MTTNNGKPDPTQYLLGRGHLMLDLFDSGGSPSGFYRHLGNCTSLTLNIEEEVLEHTNKREELASVDATVTLTKSLKGGFALDEISPENQQLFFSATAGTEDRTGAIDQDSAVVANLAKTAAMDGRHVKLYADAANLLNSAQPRLRNMTKSTTPADIEVRLDPAGSPTLLTEGTDYTLDRELGIIFWVEGGAAAGAVNIGIRFASANEDSPTVKLLQASVVRGRLLFRGENAQTGVKYEVELNKVKLQADGDANLISDEFTAMQFQLTAEKDEAYNSASPVGTITRVDHAA